jgi:hypothetical protein
MPLLEEILPESASNKNILLLQKLRSPHEQLAKFDYLTNLLDESTLEIFLFPKSRFKYFSYLNKVNVCINSHSYFTLTAESSFGLLWSLSLGESALKRRGESKSLEVF